MAGEGVSYKELALRLEAEDPSSSHSATSLATLINRGTFQFAFAMKVLKVLGVRRLDLSRLFDEQPNKPHRKPRR